jgi:hypothetical protein
MISTLKWTLIGWYMPKSTLIGWYPPKSTLIGWYLPNSSTFEEKNRTEFYSIKVCPSFSSKFSLIVDTVKNWWRTYPSFSSKFSLMVDTVKNWSRTYPRFLWWLTLLKIDEELVQVFFDGWHCYKLIKNLSKFSLMVDTVTNWWRNYPSFLWLKPFIVSMRL